MKTPTPDLQALLDALPEGEYRAFSEKGGVHIIWRIVHGPPGGAPFEGSESIGGFREKTVAQLMALAPDLAREVIELRAVVAAYRAQQPTKDIRAAIEALEGAMAQWDVGGEE